MIAPRNSEATNPQRKSGKVRVWPWLAALAFTVIVCIGVMWLLNGKSIDPNAENKNIGSLIQDAGGIKSVRNVDGLSSDEATSLTNEANDVEVEQPPTPKVDPKMVGRLVNPPVRKKLFKHVSDAQIGRVLAIRPGGLVLGKLNYHRNHFVENFKKPLEDPEPVIFSDDDTPEERALKEAVLEARAELKSALEQGEDIAQIMQDTEEELHEMQQYRMSMREQMLKYQKEDANTVEDLEDFEAAVNQMLSEKGINSLRSAKLRAIKAKLNRENNP